MDQRIEERELSFEELMQDERFRAQLEAYIASLLEGERERWTQEVKLEMEEARRVSEMSQEERASHELEARAQELDERERRIEKRELRALALELISERGLPAELADAADYAGEQALRASLDALEKAFGMAVQRGIEQRMRGETPVLPKRDLESARSDEEYYRMLRAGQ